MIRKTKLFAKTASTVAALCLATPALAVGFESPSGNILCYTNVFNSGSWTEAELICLIFEAEWDLPPVYQTGVDSCDLDRTRTIVLPRYGSPELQSTCHGDIFWPIPMGAISYGSEWTLPDIRCTMATDGVMCTNSSGHGFTVNRAGQTLF